MFKTTLRSVPSRVNCPKMVHTDGDVISSSRVLLLNLSAVSDTRAAVFANQAGMVTLSCGPLVLSGILRGNNFACQPTSN